MRMSCRWTEFSPQKELGLHEIYFVSKLLAETVTYVTSSLEINMTRKRLDGLHNFREAYRSTEEAVSAEPSRAC
jgi:hypothetical protein